MDNISHCLPVDVRRWLFNKCNGAEQAIDSLCVCMQESELRAGWKGRREREMQAAYIHTAGAPTGIIAHTHTESERSGWKAEGRL